MATLMGPENGPNLHMDGCESCGRVAMVRLRDGSTWCGACHSAAYALGYDEEPGEPLNKFERRLNAALIFVAVLSFAIGTVIGYALAGGWDRR